METPPRPNRSSRSRPKQDPPSKGQLTIYGSNGGDTLKLFEITDFRPNNVERTTFVCGAGVQRVLTTYEIRIDDRCITICHNKLTYPDKTHSEHVAILEYNVANGTVSSSLYCGDTDTNIVGVGVENRDEYTQYQFFRFSIVHATVAPSGGGSKSYMRF